MISLTIYNTDYLRMSLAGSIAVLLGALIVGGMFPLGYLLLLLIPLILSIRAGVELDLANNKYRKLTTFAGIKNGKEWKQFSAENQLVVLTKNGSKTMFDPRMISSRAIVEGSFYELYIMDSSHLKRLYLYSTRKKEKIDNYIDQISSNSVLKLAHFNPATRR